MSKSHRKSKSKPVVPAPRAAPAASAPVALRRRLLPWKLVAVLLVTVAAFSPALRGPLLYDDFLAIDGNPSITTLWPLSIPLHPPKDQTSAGRPVSNLSFALSYAINSALGVDQRPDPAGSGKTVSYHVGNLLLHLLSGLLLFGIVRRTFRSGRFGEHWTRRGETIALFVTALWLLHPLSTAAVDYIMARTDVLVSMWYFATLYCSVRAWDAATPRSRNAWYLAGIGACLLGMGSKEVMVGAPLMVLLYDRAFRTTGWREVMAPEFRSRRWFYAGLWASLVVLVTLLADNPRSTAVGFNLGTPWYTYLVSQGYAIVHYLWLVVWPAGLTFDYGRHPFPLGVALPGLLLLAGVGVATLYAWTRAERWGWLAFSGSWFFCALAPTSSFVPLAQEIAADRRFYLALPAVLFVAVIGGFVLFDRWAARSDHAKTIEAEILRSSWWGVIAVVGLLALLTYRRSTLFGDPERIWRDTVAKAPTNARAHNNLAVILFNQSGGQSAEALRLYRRAMELDTLYADPLMNVAYSELEHGNRAEAESLLQRVVTIAPWDGPALSLLSGLLLDRGDAIGVVKLLRNSADSVPDASLLINLGVAYAGLRRPVDAEAAFRRGLAKEPTRVDLLRSLGGLLTQQGRASEALPLLEQVLAADPFSGLNQAMLAMAYAGVGKDSLAVASATYAVTAQNADGRVIILAGRAMLGANQPKLAESYLTKGIAMGPAGPEAFDALAKVREKLGMRGAAIEAYRSALHLNPADSAAVAGLARLGIRGGTNP